jgi:glycosyltransferase involved in cell wall biosynthesis
MNMDCENIVFTGIQPWNIAIGSNCKNIAEEFSHSFRVLYVNPPLDRINAVRHWKEKITKNGKPSYNFKIERINSKLFVLTTGIIIESINFLPDNIFFDKLNFRNNKKYALSIKKALSDIGFEEFYLFTDSDMLRSFYLKELLNPIINLYYLRDNLMQVKYWKKHGKRLEPLMMTKANCVIANSVYLTNIAKKYNSNSFYVGQGCDISLYNSKISHNEPEDLKEISSPKIIYTGVLSSIRLDINLIKIIALHSQKWNIVLIGPEDKVFAKSDLHSLQNIHFLGAKSPDLLPNYIAFADVCINPQINNELTKANYPRKIDEYLAMGKPIVATDTETMQPFANYVYLSKTHIIFCELVNKALSTDSPSLKEKRIEYASTHTWKQNVIEIKKCIANTLKNEA